jgi:small subunit ribosomal protein S1
VTVAAEHIDSGQSQFARLIKSEYDYTRPRQGEVREATILAIGSNDMVVDLGTKRDGIIPPRDLDLVDDVAYVDSLEIGDRVPVVILSTWGLEDGVTVSLNKGLQGQDWLRAQELLEKEQVVEAEVVDSNRGGVIVLFGRLQGFVPNSHLAALPPGLRGERLQEAKAKLVGKRLSLTVISVDQQRRRLVLSERVANSHRRQQLFQELTEGDVRTGTVCNLVDFGAFVDLGGVDGLIHISELGWKYVDHPREVLKTGDEVEVCVLNVDRERERIGLSRKRLLTDPWDQATSSLRKGDIVQGTVTGIREFGAFVSLGDGVEGLVHVSEMSDGAATFPDLEPGTPVIVAILEVDQWEHQIALRLEDISPPRTDPET